MSVREENGKEAPVGPAEVKSFADLGLSEESRAAVDNKVNLYQFKLDLSMKG